MELWMILGLRHFGGVNWLKMFSNCFSRPEQFIQSMKSFFASWAIRSEHQIFFSRPEQLAQSMKSFFASWAISSEHQNVFRVLSNSFRAPKCFSRPEQFIQSMKSFFTPWTVRSEHQIIFHVLSSLLRAPIFFQDLPQAARHSFFQDLTHILSSRCFT